MMVHPRQSPAGRYLCGDAAAGPILKLEEPLSFWGGFDPKTGRIIDRSHPQHGRSVNGCMLALPGARGSAGTPAAIAEALRAGCGPVGFILPQPDVNITIGVIVANRLYQMKVPVCLMAPHDYQALHTGQQIQL